MAWVRGRHLIQLVRLGSCLIPWLVHLVCLVFFSEPVHVKKRKHESVIEKYEKVPRRLQTEPEKELIHLLPIKDKSGIIPQAVEKPGNTQIPELVQ